MNTSSCSIVDLSLLAHPLYDDKDNTPQRIKKGPPKRRASVDSLLAHPLYDDEDNNPHCIKEAPPKRRKEDGSRKWIKRLFGEAFLAVSVLMISVFVLAVAFLSTLEFAVAYFSPSPQSRRDRKAMAMRKALRRSMNQLEEMTESNVGFGRSVKGHQ